MNIWGRLMKLFKGPLKVGDYVYNSGKNSKYYKRVGRVVHEDSFSVDVKYPDEVALGIHPHIILKKVNKPVSNHFNENLFNV